MSEQKRKRYQGGCIRYVSSFNGTAILEVSMSRTKRTGKREYVYIEMEIDRSDINCIHSAIKAFADKERAQVTGLPL